MARQPGSDTSLTLLERVQKDPADRGAWEEFVRRYHPMIRAWCVKWGLQASDADDVAQDVLIKVLTAMRHFRYDPSGSFCAWLRTVTQHALSEFAAGRVKAPGQLDPEIPIADRADVRDDLERELEKILDRDLFQIAMRRVEARVKPHTWEAFRLTAVEGLSGQEAGTRLNMPVAHVFVAKNRVQKLLQEAVRVMKGRE